MASQRSGWERLRGVTQEDDNTGLLTGSVADLTSLQTELEDTDAAPWATYLIATNAARVANIAALNTLIADILAAGDMADWSEKLAAAGVPAGPINPIPAVFADPQVKHREMLVELPHPVAGTVPQVASPIRYAEAPIEYRRGPPLVGQHTREVLEELGIAVEG